MHRLALASALTLAACSSSSASTPAGGSSSSGGSGSGSSGGSGSSSGSSSSSGGNSGGADSGAQGDAGGSSSSSGGSSGGSDKLYPLAVGDTWTYDVQDVGAGSVCAPGTWSQKVTGTRNVDGKDAFDLQSFCSNAPVSEVAPVGTGDEVDLDFQGSWLVMIDPTLQDGHTWPYFNSSYTWKRETSVTVPAGTYTDCWTASQNVSYTAYITYCRGVGMVRSYSSDLSGNGWDAKLTSKSF